MFYGDFKTGTEKDGSDKKRAGEVWLTVMCLVVQIIFSEIARPGSLLFARPSSLLSLNLNLLQRFVG